METARRFRDERGGKAIIRDLSDGQEEREFIDDQEAQMWNNVLPMKKKRVESAAEGGADDQVERQMAQ